MRNVNSYLLVCKIDVELEKHSAENEAETGTESCKALHDA